MKLTAIRSHHKLERTQAALGRWSAHLSERTRAEYGRDLEHGAAFAGLDGAAALLAALAHAGKGPAEAFCDAWILSMSDGGLSTATMARRLSALRSMVSMLRRLELVTWSIEARSPKVEQRHERTGPTASEARHLWSFLILAGVGQLQSRQRALWRLLWDLGLRITEALSLDLDDIDIEGQSIAVRRKGHRERERITIAPQTAAALDEWIRMRPEGHGEAVFLTLAEPYVGQRLRPRAVRSWLARIGHKHLGRQLSPHRVRHGAMTAALDAGSPLRGVVSWMGHANPATVMRYDDRRKDAAGGVARVAAALLSADGVESNDTGSKPVELAPPEPTIVGKSPVPQNPKKLHEQSLLFGNKHPPQER